MSIKQTIESKSVGFRYHISLDKEIRSETVAKYPDKTNVHVSLEGHTDTLKEAETQLKQVKLELEKLLHEVQKA